MTLCNQGLSTAKNFVLKYIQLYFCYQKSRTWFGDEDATEEDNDNNDNYDNDNDENDENNDNVECVTHPLPSLSRAWKASSARVIISVWQFSVSVSHSFYITFFIYLFIYYFTYTCLQKWSIFFNLVYMAMESNTSADDIFCSFNEGRKQKEEKAEKY